MWYGYSCVQTLLCIYQTLSVLLVVIGSGNLTGVVNNYDSFVAIYYDNVLPNIVETTRMGRHSKDGETPQGYGEAQQGSPETPRDVRHHKDMVKHKDHQRHQET